MQKLIDSHPGLVEVLYNPGKKLICSYREGTIFYARQYFPEHKDFSMLNDPKMPWLKDLCDLSFVQTLLGKKIQRITPLSYKPESRATFLFELTDGSLIGKTHATKDGKHSYLAAKELASQGVNIPAAHAYYHYPPLTLTECLCGKTWQLKDGQIGSIGRALKKLHSSVVTAPLESQIPSFIKSLEKSRSLVEALFPQLAARSRALAEELASLLQKTLKNNELIHADFHKSNLLTTQNGIAILDLEDLSRGDKRIDLGRFLASCRVPYLRKHGFLEGFETIRQSFLGGCGPNGLYLFESAFLFTSAATGFRFQRNGWEKEGPALFAEAEKILDSNQLETLS